MGHLLRKQIIVALLCLSMAVTTSATRKEDLERAAELAVERAAEKAAERAVEKALEAGNTTSTTITVKESYSNARKTAEEQAAPGSESTRYQNKKTSVFETKDVSENSDYESNLNGSDYSDYNDTRTYEDDDDSVGYGDYDSRGYDDYNDTLGYSDYNESRDYREPRGFTDYNDFKGDTDSNDFSGSENSRNFKNYKDTRGYRDLNQSKETQDHDSKNSNDYGESKGYEVEDDYSFMNDTDYQKLNNSKPSTDSDTQGTFGDFDDSDFRHEFGTKLTGADAKVEDSSLEEDFYASETDLLKKKDSKKEDDDEETEDKDDEETEDKDDDSWKSYSDWKKDFKSIDDDSFAKVSFWDDDESPLKKGESFWSDDDDILSGDNKNIGEEKEESGKEPKSKKDSKPNEKSSTNKASRKSSGKEYDFGSMKSWPVDDYDDDDDDEDDVNDKSKKSKSISKSYSRRSSNEDNLHGISSPFRSLSYKTNNQKQNSTNTLTGKTSISTKTKKPTTNRNFKESKDNFKETSNETEDKSKEEYKSRTKERITDQYNERIPEITTEQNRFKKIALEEEIRSGSYRSRNNERIGYKNLPYIGQKNVTENIRRLEPRPFPVENERRKSKNVRRPEFPFYRIEEKERSLLKSVPLEENKRGSIDIRRFSRPYEEEKRVPVMLRNVPLSTPKPYTQTLPPFWINRKIPDDIKKDSGLENVPVTINPLRRNHRKKFQRNVEQSSLVKFPRKILDSISVTTDYPFVHSTTLKVQKPIYKIINRYPHENKKFYTEQKRLQVKSEQQQLDKKDQHSMLVKLALPGPFPVESIHLPPEKPLPFNNQVNNPYAINLDKSISMALGKRMPFIIHLPIKPIENQKRPKNRFTKKLDNEPTESRNWIKRIRWMGA